LNARWLQRCGAMAFLTSAACGALPEIEPGVCGNAVVETGETCDGFANGDARCRPPGALQPCQLDCSAGPDNLRPACPSGWGCGVGDVCREATGRYREQPARISGHTQSLLAGDFDGDGRGDIVDLEPTSVGATRLRLHFFDRDGGLAQTWSPQIPFLSSVVADVSGDSRSDLVAAFGFFGVLLGQSDRSVIPEMYATFFLANQRVRLVNGLFDADVERTSPVVALVEEGGMLEWVVPDLRSMNLKPVAELGFGLDELASPPALGRVSREDDNDAAHPCSDVALARRGATSLSVFSFCERDEQQSVVWRESPEVLEVALRPRRDIVSGPLFADVDGDGHLDVLVGAGSEGESELYVAFGDGTSLQSARPLRARVSRPAAEVDPLLMMPTPSPEASAVAMPMTAGDFTGDGAAELVYPDGIMFSDIGESRSDLGYENRRGGEDWSAALIADFNANGAPDFVGVSNRNLNIDFLNGTATPRVNPFVIPTAFPIEHLAVADLDGDLVNDLAFTQAGAPDQPLGLAVAFGNRMGAPSLPMIAARLPNIRQIGSFGQSTGTTTHRMFATYEQIDDSGDTGSAVAWLEASGARDFINALELTSFAANGSLEGDAGVGVITGAFVQPGRVDALVLALGSNIDQERSPNMWLLQDLRGRRSRPEDLGWSFDPSLTPLFGLEIKSRVPRLAFSTAAGDFDGDGLDEFVIAAPDQAAEHCLLSRAHIMSDAESAKLVAQAPIWLEPRCTGESRLGVHDLDEDGAAEIVLLTGDSQGPRRLSVFWNDGGGDISAESESVLAGEDENPQAFAVFRATSQSPLTFAYLTSSALRLLRVSGRELVAVEEQPELGFERGSSLVATDIDGDGIEDLVAADAGNIRVLMAELTP
jgi:hypothetical protein